MEPNKTHATRLKSTIFKTQAISYNKLNQSHELPCNENLFLSYQTVPKVKIYCSYLKQGDIYWFEETKSNVWLENKGCSLMAKSLLTIFQLCLKFRSVRTF